MCTFVSKNEENYFLDIRSEQKFISEGLQQV